MTSAGSSSPEAEDIGLLFLCGLFPLAFSHRGEADYCRDPLEIVTIKVDGKDFKLHKTLLVKDSEYFRRALNGPFIEARRQEITLGHDVTAEEFGVYVDVLYRSYFNPCLEFKYTPVWNACSVHGAMNLWKCSDRFLNDRLLDIAEDCLDFYLAMLTPTRWESFYQSHSIEQLRYRAGECESVAEYCRNANLPYYERFVEAFANMPPQAFAECIEECSPPFGLAASREFAARLVDPAPKRKADEDNAMRASKKPHLNTA